MNSFQGFRCARCAEEVQSQTPNRRCPHCGVGGSLFASPATNLSRRRFLGALGLGAAAFATRDLWERGAFAEELVRPTPWVTEGPYYPPRLPLERDNDLIIVGNSTTPAVGEITHLSGRLLNSKGEPIKNAVVEIWQCDAQAVYLVERGGDIDYDSHFQGFGQFETGSDGEYRFRTIKPVPYEGRPAAHIHFKVKVPKQPEWTTQLYIKGFAGNRRDGIYSEIGSAEDQQSVTVDFKPLPNSRIKELAARFDIVPGATPRDGGPGRGPGGPGRGGPGGGPGRGPGGPPGPPPDGPGWDDGDVGF